MEGWGWEDVRDCFLKSEKADVGVEGVHNTKGKLAEGAYRMASADDFRYDQDCGGTGHTRTSTSGALESMSQSAVIIS